tara:strand:- start:506 stop:694 length:189 start_codon:yes stop_codon:yes gene_type:complete
MPTVIHAELAAFLTFQTGGLDEVSTQGWNATFVVGSDDPELCVNNASKLSLISDLTFGNVAF